MLELKISVQEDNKSVCLDEGMEVVLLKEFYTKWTF